MSRNRKLIITGIAALCGAGCASLDPRGEVSQAAREIEDATGTNAAGILLDAEAASVRVAELLSDGLTADEAVQVGLLNNPRIRAAIFKLGISHAEAVQSGLLSNPTLSFSLRWPDGGGLTNLQAGLAQNIAELWQIPSRKEAAQRELDRTVLEVARDASALLLDSRVAYWQAVRARRAEEVERDNLSIAEKLVQLAESRRDAGAGSEVDVNLARSRHADGELRLRNALLARTEALSGLARLLGLTTPPDDLVLTDRLAEPEAWKLAPDSVIATAIDSRLDARALRMAVAAAQARVEFEKSRFLRTVELGISAERSARQGPGDRNWLSETAFASAQAGQFTPPNLEPRDRESTEWVIGPELGVELPIFDQNQIQLVRAEYVHQQAVNVLEGLERELSQDAYVAVQRARTASENARFFRDSMLPLREDGLMLAQGAYTAGRTTLLSVQEAQKLLLEARSGYVEALANHASAIVEVERVAGRPFATLLGGAQAVESIDPTMPTEKNE